MATIFYSMAGEGRGHATRVRTVVEHLRREHHLVLLAPHHAFNMLSQFYTHCADVTLIEIPGLLAHYRGQKLNYLKTGLGGVPYCLKSHQLVQRLVRLIRAYEPELIITDFEPALPRAAKRCGLPFVSFDHQHFLVVNDLSCLPARLRLKSALMGSFVKRYYTGQQKTIVSSFYAPPLKPKHADAVQAGVLLRPEILAAEPEVERHVLVYLRRFASPQFLETLSRCGRDVKVYGLGKRPGEGRVEYFDIDESGFVEDLRTCEALICNAGNQLVGEAFFLQKPVLGLPETGNFEQQVNGHFIKQSGGGDCVKFTSVTDTDIRRFLDRVPEHRAAIDPRRVVGNEVALDALESLLPAGKPAQMPDLVSAETREKAAV